MKIEIDTKEDSHDDIRKVIKMLQHMVGDSQEIFTNQPNSTGEISQETGSAFNSMFGDTVSIPESNSASAESSQETQTEESVSTEDLFAELFSEEELKKMEPIKEEEVKPKGKKYDIELY